MRRTETFLKIALWTAVFGFVSAGSLFAVKSFRNLSASAVRGVAFFDCNADGLKNVGETGFGNVAVVLAGRSTAGDSVRLTTTTDAAGLYSFPGVAAGVYRVSFAFPLGSSGLQFSPRGDSKANPDGSTDPFSMDGTADATGIDVGIIDHIAPKITFTNPLLATVLSGDTLSFECDNAPILNETYAIARDNSGKTLPISFVDSARRVGSCQRDGFLYLLHCAWNAADDCGNAASIEVFIKIIDSTPPTLNGIPADLTVNMVRGETVPPAATGVTGADNCTSSGLSIAFSEEAATNTCGKIITRTWKTADACGNQGARSQRITVVSNSSCDSNGLTATDTFRLTLLNRNGNPTDTCLNLGAGRRFTDLQHCGVNVPQVSASLRGGSCLELNPSVFFSGLDTCIVTRCASSTSSRYARSRWPRTATL